MRRVTSNIRTHSRPVIDAQALKVNSERSSSLECRPHGQEVGVEGVGLRNDLFCHWPRKASTISTVTDERLQRHTIHHGGPGIDEHLKARSINFAVWPRSLRWAENLSDLVRGSPKLIRTRKLDLQNSATKSAHGPHKFWNPNEGKRRGFVVGASCGPRFPPTMSATEATKRYDTHCAS